MGSIRCLDRDRGVGRGTDDIPRNDGLCWGGSWPKVRNSVLNDGKQLKYPGTWEDLWKEIGREIPKFLDARKDAEEDQDDEGFYPLHTAFNMLPPVFGKQGNPTYVYTCDYCSYTNLFSLI